MACNRNRVQVESRGAVNPIEPAPPQQLQLLPAEVLIGKIKSGACAFDTAPTALKTLKASGVPDKAIFAMIKAPVVQPGTVVPVIVPSAPEVSNVAGPGFSPERWQDLRPRHG